MLARARLLDEAVRVGLRPRASRAARSAASPEASASRCPRPSQFPWQRRAVRLDDDVARARPSRGTGARRARPRRRHRCRARARSDRLAPRPAPSRHSASAVALPSFSSPTGKPNLSRRRAAEVEVARAGGCSRAARPRRAVDRHRDADPDRSRTVVEQLLDHGVELADERARSRRSVWGPRSSARSSRRARACRRGSSSRRRPLR